MNAMKNRRVALVLDPNFGQECQRLLKLMPIWIVDSITNRKAVDDIREGERNESNLTTFQARDGESPAAMCERIVQSLDDHYNERSQSPEYAELNVIGVQLDEVKRPIFHELGFSEFSRTPGGFVARKLT